MLHSHEPRGTRTVHVSFLSLSPSIFPSWYLPLIASGWLIRWTSRSFLMSCLSFWHRGSLLASFFQLSNVVKILDYFLVCRSPGVLCPSSCWTCQHGSGLIFIYLSFLASTHVTTLAVDPPLGFLGTYRTSWTRREAAVQRKEGILRAQLCRCLFLRNITAAGNRLEVSGFFVEDTARF